MLSEKNQKLKILNSYYVYFTLHNKKWRLFRGFLIKFLLSFLKTIANLGFYKESGERHQADTILSNWPVNASSQLVLCWTAGRGETHPYCRVESIDLWTNEVNTKLMVTMCTTLQRISYQITFWVPYSTIIWVVKKFKYVTIINKTH